MGPRHVWLATHGRLRTLQQPAHARSRPCQGARQDGGQLTVRLIDGCAVAELRGEVDIAVVNRCAPRLDELLARPHGLVVVDLSGVSFLDCAGLRMLIRIRRGTQAHGDRLAVVCAEPRVLRLFRLTGLQGVFRPVPTLLAATQPG